MENRLFSNCSVVGCGGRSIPKSRTSMISQSFQINHLLPSLFKECRISVLPVPVYPPRILRLKDCSKPYYIIAESFVPLFNNINFFKTIFDKMIGKALLLIPTPTMYSNFVRCNCNRFSDKIVWFYILKTNFDSPFFDSFL
jgi:hypothetical protein